MKENISTGLAVLAIVISIAAITSTVIVKPVSTVGANSVSGNELADNSVTSGKVADGALTDADISDSGISKIADDAITSDQIASSSITLLHLTSEVIAAMTGVVDIANNSITGAKLANGTITKVHISDSADIDPSKILGTAWTATNDGSASGLDADTLDGINSGKFLRNDMPGTIAGDLTVNGSITHQAETRYYTIPFCSFVGNEENTPYRHSADILTNPDPAFASHDYSAPVNLPNRATITKVTVRYYNSDALATAWFYLEKVGTVYSTVAIISLPQNTGLTNYETEVSATIDNNNQAYWARVGLDPNDSEYDIQLTWVCIEYTVTNPLP